MGSYASVAVRDAQGNIVGYQSTTTGGMVEVTGAASPAFQQQLALANAQKYLSVGTQGSYQQSIQYVPDQYIDTRSAAGIAQLVGRSGGAVEVGVAQRALGQGLDPSLINVAGVGAGGQRINTPVSDIYSGVAPITSIDTGQATVQGDRAVEAYKSRAMDLAGIGFAALQGIPISGGMRAGELTTYVPYGSYAQTELKGTKLAIEPTTGELAIYQQAGEGRNIYNLIGGGGRAALQSGMFSVGAPLTPYITTQEGVGKYVLPSGEGLSRLGAEAYGGYVRQLDNRVLTPDSRMSTYESPYNLANLVNPQGANMGKAEAPGAKIPWYVSGEAPAISVMGPGGIVGSVVSPVGTSDRLVGGKTIASVATVTPTEPAALPSPYISASTGTIKPTGEVFGVRIPVASDLIALFQPEQRVTSTLERTKIPEVTTLTGTEYSYDAMGNLVTTKKYETTGGTVGNLKTVTTPIEGSSAYDKLNASIRESLKLPTPEMGERGVQLASLANPFAFQPVVTSLVSEKLTGSTATQVFEPLRGQYTQFYEQPLLVPLSYGVGAGFGTLAKGVETAYMGTRGLAAEQIIGSGQTARSVEQFGGLVMGRAPQVLTALYTVDITGRATRGGTDISPESVSRLKGLTLQEAGAMGAGFALPESALTKIGETKIAYRDIQQTIAGERTVAQGLGKEPVKPSDVTFNDVVNYRYSPTVSKIQIEAGRILGGIPELATTERLATFEQARTPLFERGVSAVKSTATSVSEYLNRPYASEVTRAYYPYEGIVQTAYPKSNVFESVVARTRVGISDIPQTIQIGAKDLGRNIRYSLEYTPKPEFSRTNIAPENEYAFRYPEGKPLEEVVFSKTLSRVLPPSTFGESRVVGTLPSTSLSGEKGTTTTTKGGAGGFGQGRVSGTRIVGGKVTPSLAREPSLKSQGVLGKAGSTTSFGGERSFAEQRSVDFRGRPASETMKPMGERTTGTKQASGAVSILTERLPVVEGMPATRMSPQQAQLPYMLAPQESMGVVQVTEPQLEFSQERRTTFATTIEPASRSVQAQEVAGRQAIGLEVSQAQRQEQLPVLAQSIASAFGIRSINARESAFDRSQRFARENVYDITAIPDITTRTGTSFDTTFRQTTDQTTRITTGGTPYKTPYVDIIEVPGVVPGWNPFGGSTPTGMKRRRKPFAETFNIGLDLSTFGPKAYNPMGGPAGGFATKRRAPKKKLTSRKRGKK